MQRSTGGDPDRLFAFGDSAGGALALTATYAAAAGVAESSCGGTVPRVRAVAAEYPAVDPTTFYENSNPLFRGLARQMVGGYLGGSPREYPERARFVSSATYVTPEAPPTLIFLVENDHLVPIAGALDFIKRAERVGVNVQTVRFPWADHAVNLQSVQRGESGDAADHVAALLPVCHQRGSSTLLNVTAPRCRRARPRTPTPTPDSRAYTGQTTDRLRVGTR